MRGSANPLSSDRADNCGEAEPISTEQRPARTSFVSPGERNRLAPVAARFVQDGAEDVVAGVFVGRRRARQVRAVAGALRGPLCAGRWHKPVQAGEPVRRAVVQRGLGRKRLRTLPRNRLHLQRRNQGSDRRHQRPHSALLPGRHHVGGSVLRLHGGAPAVSVPRGDPRHRGRRRHAGGRDCAVQRVLRDLHRVHVGDRHGRRGPHVPRTQPRLRSLPGLGPGEPRVGRLQSSAQNGCQHQLDQGRQDPVRVQQLCRFRRHLQRHEAGRLHRDGQRALRPDRRLRWHDPLDDRVGARGPLDDVAHARSSRESELLRGSAQVPRRHTHVVARVLHSVGRESVRRHHHRALPERHGGGTDRLHEPGRPLRLVLAADQLRPQDGASLPRRPPHARQQVHAHSGPQKCRIRGHLQRVVVAHQPEQTHHVHGAHGHGAGQVRNALAKLSRPMLALLSIHVVRRLQTAPLVTPPQRRHKHESIDRK